MKFVKHLKMIVIFAAFLLLSNCSGSKQALLWEVSGKNLSEPSYLYGTIHLIGKADFAVSPIVEEKFNASKKLALEIKMDSPTLQAEMLAGMMMSDGQTLKSLMGEKYDAFEKFCTDSLQLNLAMFQAVKPFFLQVMMLQKVIDEPVPGYDMHFMKLAQDAGMEIVGLELLADQMAVFDSIPLEKQVEMLYEMTENFSGQRKLYDQLVKLYKAQDIKGMQKLMLTQPEYEAYEDVLLNKRNRNWIPAIKELAAQGATFIAFGAGHLPGEEGVVNLLKKEGYTVKPLLEKK